MPETEFDPEQFQRIIAYHRDCLDNDTERSVVFHQSDEDQRFIPLKLEREWTVSGKGELRADLEGDKSRFASELRQRRSSAEIMYGYPFLVKRSYNRGISLIPVFLQPVEHDHDLKDDELTVRLVHDWPVVNEEFCRSIGVSTREEKAQLYEQLGLTADMELPPEGLSYFVRRLKDLKQLPEGELLDPSCIPRGSISQAAKFADTLNRHALVITDRPPFTRGLDAELSTLNQERHFESVGSTASSFLFGVNARNRLDENDRDTDITEVVPLNDEQRRAVRSAFQNDLTVVTGPPGTGKSQIVTTVIANAWFRRQSVLFASYNHKAVDVVEQRVNRLTSKPLIVRTGRRSGDRDLRNEITGFLSNLLASDASDQERQNLKDARRLFGQLELNREKIWRDLESVRIQHNRVDQIDQDIENIKPDREQLESECEDARRVRDSNVRAIDTKINTLTSAIESLQRNGDCAGVSLPHIDREFVADIDRRYRELDSLRNQVEFATRQRDAEIDSINGKLARLRSDFDPHLLERGNSQDYGAIRSLMLSAQMTLESQSSIRSTTWGNLWKRIKRRADFKRVETLTGSWADDYDMLGTPPTGQITPEKLAMWSNYLADAISSLDEWERDYEHNKQTTAAIEKLENEIVLIQTDFESNRFEIRTINIEKTIRDLVEQKVQTLHSQIDNLNAQRNEAERKFDAVNLRRVAVEKTFSQRSRDFADAVAKLSVLQKVNELADRLAKVEKQIWDAGAKLVDASIRNISDEFNSETREAINAFRALFEQLQDDQLGGQRYARLMREMENLFPKVMSALPAWCVTNLSARGNIPLHAGMFDLVVIDEASQCSIPSALPLLFRAKRALIIGDPNQLRHITTIGSRKDQELQEQHGLQASDVVFSFKQESLFDLASSKANPITLREHFRSHADIISFSNQHWYGDRLMVCTDYDDLNTPTGQEPGIRWHNVDGRVERSPAYNGNINRTEAEELSEQVVELIANRGFRGTVGIVTPFRAQANLVQGIINQRLDLPDVQRCELITDTAHAFQGDEKDVVFFSPCVEFQMPSGAEWFIAATDNLFNVAITRPRALLVVVGNLDVFGVGNPPCQGVRGAAIGS